MIARQVEIARCPTHGLHGERTRCFVCGGRVQQVPMIEVAALKRLLAEMHAQTGKCGDWSEAVHEVERWLRDGEILFPLPEIDEELRTTPRRSLRGRVRGWIGR